MKNFGVFALCFCLSISIALCSNKSSEPIYANPTLEKVAPSTSDTEGTEGEYEMLQDVSQKLEELRKEKNLTQEELDEILFASRAAISKWKSGCGYQNIDSIKAIGDYFSITMDELRSGQTLLD